MSQVLMLHPSVTIKTLTTKTKVGATVELHGTRGIGYATMVGRKKKLVLLNMGGQLIGVGRRP